MQEFRSIDLKNDSKRVYMEVMNGPVLISHQHHGEMVLVRKSEYEAASKSNKKVAVLKPEDSKATEMQRRVDKVLDYLNQATGRKFAKSPELTARIKDGNTFDQFKAVIDYKANEWMGGDMQKYIRPQTLFNASKFQGYLADCEQGVPINSKQHTANQREAELDEWMGGGQSQDSLVIDND